MWMSRDVQASLQKVALFLFFVPDEGSKGANPFYLQWILLLTV